MTTPGADDARFAALWGRCVSAPPSPAAAEVYAWLASMLGAPQRRFHNLGHIHECLRHMDEVVPLLRDPTAVELALWFHDAVYTPGDPTNERRSAEFFLEVSAGASQVLRRRVCVLILATRHASIASVGDRRFIEDIDLVGFGAPWDQFMRAGDLLRLEFADQPDVQYYTGQLRFLEQLARRPVFFWTERFRQRHEAQAQDNLRRLLAMRRAEGYGTPAPG